ncbi:MAG: protein kinase [Byssovorax sp.]
MSDDFPIESRFVIEARVGRGASGEVFKATDRETGRPVAVKRLLSIHDDAAALDRFRREARLLSIVDDSRLVRYVAHGVDATLQPCLVVEWLEGEDLARRQRRQRLTVAEALDVAWQTALGLHALHEAGVVHRDVKPANVYLVGDDDGALRVKLIDLGIARAAGEATLTQHGVALGTPFYMAPEQARGEERVTAKADQFSLGVMLFELIAGKRPFTGDDFFTVLAKIVLQDPPRLRDACAGVPPELDALVRRAMSKAAADRFPSARELADAIAAVPAWEGPRPQIEGGGDALTSRVALAMSVSIEQRVVTVLFASAPGDAARMALAAIAEQHGASCHPTLGRRMIAVFGVDRTHGDEAVRAGRAALLASARVPGASLFIATGRALSGTTGLTGDLLERGAGELDGDGDPAVEARPIHVDEATAALLDEHFLIEGSAGARSLLGLRPAAPAPRTLVGKPTPCVGRDRELANLEALFAECVGEPVARAVVILGAPGVGKSRLRYELLARLVRAEPRPEVLLGRGSPLAEGSAFGLLAPAIRRFVGILDGEPAAIQRDKLAARIGPRVSPAALALIGELAGVPGVSAKLGAPVPRRDAMLTGDLMRAAWLEWLDAECAAAPVILVVEDLHWGDVASVGFLDAALRALAERPFFVVALARPEVHERFPTLWAGRDAQEIRLGPLLPKASERLVRAALGDSVDPAAVQRIVARAEGNAFFMEELIRAVACGSGDSLPDTVLGMVQARLDALGPEAKRILRAASLFGPIFWSGGVAALLGEPAEALREPLERLCTGEMIARRKDASFPGEDELVFRHALVREAAYAMVPDADQRVGHRLAGAWLEHMGAVDPAILALHFERGDELAQAARYHGRAAEKALAGNDFAGAVSHAERAIDCGARDEERGAAALIRAEAHRWRGELGSATAAAAEAAEHLASGGSAWFHAVREAIAANGRRGSFDLVSLWAAEALAAVGAPETVGPRIACLVPAAVQLTYAGHTDEATALVAEIDRLAATAGEPGLDPTVTARIHQLRAVHADQDGDLEAALAHHEASLASFERIGDLRNACLTLSNLGFVRASLGRLPEAEEALLRAGAGAERMGLTTVAALALHNLGGVRASLGRLDEARVDEERAVAAFRAGGDPRLEGASRVYLARILLAMGDAAGSEAEARTVAENAASPAPLRAGALAALAEAVRAQGRAGEALIAAKEAAGLLAAIKSIEDFEVLIGIACSEALEACGEHDAAKEAIAEAWRRLSARAERLKGATRARFFGAVTDNARCRELARRWGVAGAEEG